MSYSRKIYKGKLYRSNHSIVYDDSIMLKNVVKSARVNRFSSDTKQEEIYDYIADYDDEMENFENDEKYN